MNEPNPIPQASIRHHMPVWLTWLLRLAVAAAIVAGGVLIHRRLLATAPRHERKPQGEREVTVEVEILRRRTQPITVAATGTVIPVRELSLMFQVGGRIESVHPALEPGGALPAGAVAASLERIDYELAARRAEASLGQKRNALADARTTLAIRQLEVATARSAAEQKAAALATAEADYRLELGEQAVARSGWERIEDRETTTELDRELALRQPHLRKAEANVAAAKAALASARTAVEIAEASVRAAETAILTAEIGVADAETALAQARLDLERTAVAAPFAAMVAERAAVPGMEVTSQTALARLVDRSAFWIEISLPYDRLRWIRLPEGETPGAAATVRVAGAMAGVAAWQGRVVRCLPAVEESGRQARLLVEVSDPLGQNAVPLLLNAFVTVEIEGPDLEGVFVLPRHCVHNGNEVWLRGEDGRMAIRRIESVWSNREVIVAREGLAEGEQLVTSDISSPVSGLKLALPARETEARPGGSGQGE